MRALRVDIYRPADGSDCTNGGVTGARKGATYALLLGVGLEISEAEITAQRAKGVPILTVADRPGLTRIVRPYGEKRIGMFGGCYVVTSDSRFPSDHPLAVHDRFE